MKLINDWRRVTAFSLSFYMQVFGLFVLIIPELWYAMTGHDYNPYIAWWLGVGLIIAGLVGRIVQQGSSLWREWVRIISIVAVVALAAVLAAHQVKADDQLYAMAKVPPKTVEAVKANPSSEEATLAIAVPFIAKEEGVRLVAYRDIVGVPTICYGSTRGVTMGMQKTMAECTALLRAEVAEYREKLHAFFTSETIRYRLPPTRDTAYTSLAFNVGVAGAGKSTATKRLNVGDIAGGCRALTWWNKAGQRVVRGLVLRREREEALCMQGIH